MAATMRERLEAELADRYEIERELGRGGMATVWLARDRRHERAVAIKVLHPELAGAIGIDRFVREVRLTARLQHRSIVPVLDSGKLSAAGDVVLPWYAMPYVPGESLRARIAREVQLPVEEAVQIARDVASALQAAHAQGVIHRDIKPENIVLGAENVYVVDFGIAKALLDTGDQRITSTGLALGTPTYMSPEQASAGVVDARSDQYSLAAVLYEMLAGEPPVTGPNAQAIIARRFAEPARPIRPVRSGVPEQIERAVLRALERVPADRFPDVKAFAAQLDQVATPTGLLRSRRNLRSVLTLGVVTLFVASTVAAWAALGRRAKTSAPRDSELLGLYQRGMQAYDRRTPAGAAEAIVSFSAAIARDSSFALGWVGLARTYVRAYERQFVFPGVLRDSVLRLAVRAVDRALALDGENAHAWAAQASVARNVDPTDVSPAIRAARKAIALDSMNGPAWHFLAISLAELGDMNAALDAWRQCVRRNPTYTQGLAFLSQGHYWHRQFDSALVWADSAIAVDANYLFGRTSFGMAAIETGDSERAIAAFDAGRRLSTDVEVVNTLAGRALAEARGRKVGEARSTLRLVDSLVRPYSPIPVHTAVYIGHAYAALGDAKRAIAWLERYSMKADLHYQLHIRCDAPFAAIANAPRYRALLVTPPRGGRC